MPKIVEHNVSIPELRKAGAGTFPWCENVMMHEAYEEHTKITFDSGKSKTIPTDLAWYNMIMWHTYIQLGIPFGPEEIYEDKYTNGDIAKVMTHQRILLFSLSDVRVEADDVTRAHWDIWNYLFNANLKHMRAFVSSLSALTLSKIQTHPKLRELTAVQFDATQNTERAEGLSKELSKKLNYLVGTPGEIPGNVLLPFYQVGMLKKNQIPQQMLHYGARSDIDDTMFKHVISSSAMDGLQSVQDYAVESASAKKAEHLKKTTIKDTQYFARELRLMASILGVKYKGHCGNDVLVPIDIPVGKSSEFLDKVVYIDGKKIAITRDSCKELEGKRVSMVSPITCRYTDGVCEVCAGRATDRPWDWMPDIHLGIYAATKVGDSVSQKVLSAKHLIKTSSVTYQLRPEYLKYLSVDGTDIYLQQAQAKGLSKSFVKIPEEALHGHLADLSHGVTLEESFSEVRDMQLILADGLTETFELESDRIIPYFSKYFLEHVRKVLPNIDTTEDECLIIPLKGFKLSKPIMRYVIINDDMIAFSKQVEGMFKTEIASYTSVTNALNNITRILYTKTSLNIFYIEILLKVFLRRADGVPGLATVTDPNEVLFHNIKTGIASHSVTMKLSHERNGIKGQGENYLADPRTNMPPNKVAGAYDPYFGQRTGLS